LYVPKQQFDWNDGTEWADIRRKYHGKNKIWSSQEALLNDQALLADLRKVFALVANTESRMVFVYKTKTNRGEWTCRAEEGNKVFKLRYMKKKVTEMSFEEYINKQMDSAIHCYKGMDCVPYSDLYPQNVTLSDDVFNIMPPFKAKILHHEKFDRAKVKYAYGHIQHIFHGNQKHVNWIMSWFHDTSHGKRTRSFYSHKHQIGKGILFNDIIVDRVFGGEISCMISGIDELMESWNDWRVGKLYCFVDELAVSKDLWHPMWQKLKSMLTQSNFKVNKKFVNSYTVRSLMNPVGAGNDPRALNVEQENQRIAIFRCNEEFDNKTQHFAELLK
jgi:hypothetical protein